jgi:hypothetical protein
VCCGSACVSIIGSGIDVETFRSIPSPAWLVMWQRRLRLAQTGRSVGAILCYVFDLAPRDLSQGEFQDRPRLGAGLAEREVRFIVQHARRVCNRFPCRMVSRKYLTSQLPVCHNVFYDMR